LEHNSRTKTNLVNHCVKFHLTEWESSQSLFQNPNFTNQVSDGSQIMKLFGQAAQSQFEKDLINYVIADQVPYSIVESASFRLMMQNKNAKLKLSSSETISRKVLKLCKESRPQVFLYLRSSANQFSFTTDIRTSDAGTPFMSLTVHLITPQFELISALVDIPSLKGTHTGAVIAECFVMMMNEFFQGEPYLGRICGVATDNASNNEAAIDILIKQRILRNPEGHIRCFAHVLNLAAESAIKPLNTQIAKLRRIIKFIRGSNVQRTMYENICIEIDRKYLVPVIDVVTRWNSTYKMLEYGVCYQEPLIRHLNELIKDKAKSEGGNFSEEVKLIFPSL